MKETEKIAGNTRAYRRLHRFLALPLFALLFLMGSTGLLLGWKKQASLTPPTLEGSSALVADWISLDSLLSVAEAYAIDSLGLDGQIDRLDIRPGKAAAKVIFKHHYTEIQIDCASGKVLSVRKRWNDLLEQIHDGSIADRWIGAGGEQVKLTYTTFVSLGLIALSFSGFWLWYNPLRIRRIKGRKS